MSDDRRAVGEAAPFPLPRPATQRPRALEVRERLRRAGPSSLSGGELVGLLVGPGSKHMPPERMATRLLRRHGLRALAELDAEGWGAIEDLSPAAAARLRAALELGRRAYAPGRLPERPRLNRPDQAHRLVRHLGRARREHLLGLYLDAQNGLLHRETISIGALNTTRTHPREIFYPAIAHLALGFILVHNHPSGCLEPSPEDLEFTRAVKRAGEIMGIELYDHLIVAGDAYTSLRQRGLLSG